MVIRESRGVRVQGKRAGGAHRIGGEQIVDAAHDDVLVAQTQRHLRLSLVVAAAAQNTTTSLAATVQSWTIPDDVATPIALYVATIDVAYNRRVREFDNRSVVTNLTTVCEGPLDFHADSHVCADSGFVLKQKCEGIAGMLVSFCPSRHPACSQLQQEKEDFAAFSSINPFVLGLANCFAANYTELTTQCKCTVALKRNDNYFNKSAKH